MKKFKVGLESLFAETTEAFQHETLALVEEKKQEEVKSRPIERVRSKSSSSKNFTSDLDSLLEEAWSETETDIKVKNVKDNQTKVRKSPLAISGLDSLIRKTIDVNFIQEQKDADIKRLTFTIDKQRLRKLKQIARIEKAYLKDILGELVANYIKKYENE